MVCTVPQETACIFPEYVPLPNQDLNEPHLCRDCMHLQNFHREQPSPGNGKDGLERIAVMYKAK
jgi:hypothetical protein